MKRAVRAVALPADYALRATSSLPSQAWVPGRPGCSRHLSCSCCQRLPIHPPGRLEHLSTQAFSSPHLPLPPRLPYSADSVPFKRHIAALQTALLSPKSDDSWTVYKALHPSLHRHLSRQHVRSLFDKQTESPRRAWTRCRTLWVASRAGDLAPDALTSGQLQSLFHMGIAAVQKQGPTVELKANLEQIWKALSSSIGIKHLTVDTRRAWLRHQVLLDSKKWSDQRQPLAAARLLAEEGAAADLASDIEPLLCEADPEKERLLQQVLWFARRGVIFTSTAFEKSLLADLGAEKVSNPQQTEEVRVLADRVCQVLRDTGQTERAAEWTAVAERLVGPAGRHERQQESAEQILSRLASFSKAALSARRDSTERPEKLRRHLLNGITAVQQAQQLGVPVVFDVYSKLVVTMLLGVNSEPSTADLAPAIAEVWLHEGHQLEGHFPKTAANLLRRLVWFENPVKALPLAALLYRRVRAQPDAQRFAWTEGDQETFFKFATMCLSKANKDLHLPLRLYSDWRAAGWSHNAYVCRALLRRLSLEMNPAFAITVERLLTESLEEDFAINVKLAKEVLDGAIAKGESQHLQAVYRLLQRSKSLDPAAAAEMTLGAIRDHDQPDWRFAAELVTQLLKSQEKIPCAVQQDFFETLTIDIDPHELDLAERYHVALVIYHALLDCRVAILPSTLGRIALLQSLSEGTAAAKKTRDAAEVAGLGMDATPLADASTPGSLVLPVGPH